MTEKSWYIKLELNVDSKDGNLIEENLHNYFAESELQGDDVFNSCRICFGTNPDTVKTQQYKIVSEPPDKLMVYQLLCCSTGEKYT